MLGHFQLDAVLGGFFRRLSRLALVHVSQLNMLIRDLFYCPGQFADLGGILLIHRHDMQGQQRWPSVPTAAWTFDPLRSFAQSYAARPPDSDVDCKVRLSGSR
jgi:hypothetical protein